MKEKVSNLKSRHRDASSGLRKFYLSNSEIYFHASGRYCESNLNSKASD